MNLFYGENGSGKTSILEAIYFLCYGRSFRTHLMSRLSHNHTADFLIQASFMDSNQQLCSLGAEKKQDKPVKFRFSGSDIKLSELVSLVPCLLLNHDSFELLTEGPKIRRQFLDWGVFHVKHEFYHYWRTYQTCLKQRNLALKQKRSVAEIQSWDGELCRTGESIANLRAAYMNDFTPYFFEEINHLLDLANHEIQLYNGWNKESSLSEILANNLNKDLEMGYTTAGPHRADIRFLSNKKPLSDSLSRGQQKLYVWLLKLTQGKILYDNKFKPCIYLVDDLPSELDQSTKIKFVSSLNKQKGQKFITGIENSSLANLFDGEQQNMFHVKQ